MKSQTVIRGEDQDFRQFRAAMQRSVLPRLDRAFQSLFERAKCGETPGFPCFKGRNRGIRSLDNPEPMIRDGPLQVKVASVASSS
ncbi:MAG: hypothetical protein F4213_04585 [Boseongicola sp. SB0677_bin_26]|nr:hypothetical protein [Boseongicola sp. SB0665_bin_10]MYG25285.1 hypothetical protein [Boseongicola sp. SB0677_bin_26]